MQVRMYRCFILSKRRFWCLWSNSRFKSDAAVTGCGYCSRTYVSTLCQNAFCDFIRRHTIASIRMWDAARRLIVWQHGEVSWIWFPWSHQNPQQPLGGTVCSFYKRYMKAIEKHQEWQSSYFQFWQPFYSFQRSENSYHSQRSYDAQISQIWVRRRPATSNIM